MGPNFLSEKEKILVNTQIYPKATSLGLSNNINTKSQKNHRILVKLLKNNFWVQNGHKLPPSAKPDGQQKFSDSVKDLHFSIVCTCLVSMSVYMPFSVLPRRFC